MTSPTLGVTQGSIPACQEPYFEIVALWSPPPRSDIGARQVHHHVKGRLRVARNRGADGEHIHRELVQFVGAEARRTLPTEAGQLLKGRLQDASLAPSATHFPGSDEVMQHLHGG